MASEKDQEVFEITDFTTASDWERFIANIEEVINEWKFVQIKTKPPLQMNDFCNGKWKIVSESITYSGFQFVIAHHSLNVAASDEFVVSDGIQEDTSQSLKDIMNLDIDFSAPSEGLNYWYGLREYIIISPAIGENTISDESRAKLLLSSLCIAMFNTGCQIPIFIQLRQKVEQLFLGILEGKGSRTHFQIASLEYIHPSFSHLAGLLDIFKSKLGCYNVSLVSKIQISLCFTYTLKGWDYNGPWSQQPPDLDDSIVDDSINCVGNEDIGNLPFGTWIDPISVIHLSAIWPDCNDITVIESAVRTSLDPEYAPLWRAKIKFVETIPCLLGECLQEFRNLIDNDDATEALLSTRLRESGIQENFPIAHALDRLTNGITPVANVPVVLNRRKYSKQLPEGPIPELKLKDILFFLFPDAIGKESESSSTQMKDGTYDVVKDLLNSLKSATIKSLVYHLAICLCQVNYSYGKVSAVVHLWHEFVLEMRHRWENNLCIPGLEPGIPDLSKCLLSQKLQMLNYCIEKKKLRNQQCYQIAKKIHGRNADSSSDEEFYDCDDAKQTLPEKPDASDIVDSSCQQADGRLRPCGNLKLIGSDEILYIPITQDPPPMTEDQLEAHADVLLQLGTDEQGSELRAKMQSACLLSDMQSFKAANPNCQLEDFVRWYSPRDWIDGDSETVSSCSKGRLSDRMLTPNNMWITVWNNAKAIPARRQQRLFDDTKEGEKVLHYLASLTPADLSKELMLVLIHAAVEKLIENDNRSHSVVPSALQSVVIEAANFSELSQENAHQYDELIEHLKAIETMLSQSTAFESLFSRASTLVNVPMDEISSFTKELFENQVAYLPEGIRTKPGTVLRQLIKDSTKEETCLKNDYHESALKSIFPSPIRKEYILRTSVPRPIAYSTPTVQRMYCSLSDEGFRLAGAFTTDTTFQ